MIDKKPNESHIFSDIDGTLLMALNPPEENIRAVRRFVEAGGHFSLATGRSIAGARYVAENFEINAPSIMLDGAVIYDLKSDQLIDYSPLPANTCELMQLIVDTFPDVGASVSTLYDSYEVGAERPYVPPHHHNYRGRIAQVPGEWLKLVFFVPTQKMELFLTFIEEESHGEMSVMASGDMFASVMAKGCTKGSAIKRLCELGYVRPDAVVAIGDYDNDLDMLKTAAFAACPSNAIPKVKAVADRVFVHAEDGAVAQLIDYIMT